MLRRRFLLGSSLVFAMVTGVAPHALQTASANAPIIVNSTVDPGNGTCDSDECTLREAINKANTDPGADEIDFALGRLGVHVIQPASALPTITDTVTINGFTQNPPGGTSHLIEIDGTNAGTGVDGLLVTADDSVIEGLIIGNFSQNGIRFSGSGVQIEGTLIGISPTNANLANQGNGIVVNTATGSTIGGLATVDRNVISNNVLHGIDFTADTAPDGTLVEGNFIGTNVGGTAAAGNGEDGIDLRESFSTTIGGTAAAARNVISGNGVGGNSANGEHGIALTGAGVINTVIEGNYIGTDITGTLDLGNAGEGIFSDSSGASVTTIGGTAAGAGNLISGNDAGVVLLSAGGTFVEGNRIGTTADGMSGLGNDGDGIGVGGDGVTIGGTAAGAGNLVSGNGLRGIDLESNHATVQGNLVGVKADGIHALENGTEGLSIDGTTFDTIGGTAAGAGNVFAANGVNGIRVGGGSNDKIQGNFIGTDRTGKAVIGNGADGIFMDSAHNNTVGGSKTAARNVIRNNGADGIDIQDTFHTGANGNRLRRNLIAKNGSLGIDLNGDGVTPNDPGDADTGPNELQNFPVLVSAIQGTSSTAVKTKLNSLASTKFVLDFFAGAGCDPSGHGEGPKFLKTVAVMTDAAGHFVGVLNLPRVAKGKVITATATDPLGNTSEFSACRTVT